MKQHSSAQSFAGEGAALVHQRCCAQSGHYGDHQPLLCAPCCSCCPFLSSARRRRRPARAAVGHVTVLQRPAGELPVAVQFIAPLLEGRNCRVAHTLNNSHAVNSATRAHLYWRHKTNRFRAGVCTLMRACACLYPLHLPTARMNCSSLSLPATFCEYVL